MIHFGDCIDVMPTLPDRSVDLILADLPYGTTQAKWDSVIPLDRLWPEYKRLARGPVLLFAQLPFDKVLGASNLPWLRYEWVWHKTEATGHLNANKAPMKAHEVILVFAERAPLYRPIKTTGHERKTAVRHKGGSELYGQQRSGQSYDSTERYPRDVVTFSTDKQKSRLHPTQKPLALLRYLIETHSEPGAVVLDNTMGSGSTGVAAYETGRRFIGIEKDPHYFEVAQTRLGVFS